MKVRYTPYEITSHNFTHFLIQGNSLHNLIVGLFAMTDNLIETTQVYVGAMEDPLQRLLEVLLRYGVFRNLVMGV